MDVEVARQIGLFKMLPIARGVVADPETAWEEMKRIVERRVHDIFPNSECLPRLPRDVIELIERADLYFDDVD
jgi:hypothetical protein